MRQAQRRPQASAPGKRGRHRAVAEPAMRAHEAWKSLAPFPSIQGR